MVLYKKFNLRPRLTFKERLNKNKQYLKRRLLRISKRANWLKRKLSKRLKYIIKPRRTKAFYNTTTYKKKFFYRTIKSKVTELKKNKINNEILTIQHKLLSKVKAYKFNIPKVVKKILSKHSNNTFNYFN